MSVTPVGVQLIGGWRVSQLVSHSIAGTASLVNVTLNMLYKNNKKSNSSSPDLFFSSSKCTKIRWGSQQHSLRPHSRLTPISFPLRLCCLKFTPWFSSVIPSPYRNSRPGSLRGGKERKVFPGPATFGAPAIAYKY